MIFKKHAHSWFVFGAAASLAFCASFPAMAARTLPNPTPQEIYFLQQQYAHTTPDLTALAKTFLNVELANQFQEPALIQQVVAQLKQQEASVQGVNIITLNLNSWLPQYNSQYKEYDFSISDGTLISFSAFDQNTQICLTNGTTAQTWSLPPARAEQVLNEVVNNGVILALTLQLKPSPSSVDNQSSILNAKILSYDVLTSNGVKIGHVTVKDNGNS